MCLAGIFIRSVDRFNEESAHQTVLTDGVNTTPLLEGESKTAGTTETSAEP